MENQRLFLALALAFVLFLIWQAWLEDQAARTQPPVAATSSQGTVPAGAATPATPSAEQGFVPSVAPPAASSPAPGNVPGGAQRIKVVTDTFDASIDTLGGDIRYVGLPTYPASLSRKDQPFVLLQDTAAEVFIAQTGLVSPSGNAPNHYAQFVAEQTEYRMEEGQDSLQVPVTWSDGSGIVVTKTYTFHRGSFVIDVTQRVENGSTQEWRGSPYRQLQRTPPASSSSGLGMGVYTYTGGVISTPETHYEKIDFDDMASQDLNLQVIGGWVAMIQHYFLAAWVPDQDTLDTFYTKVVDGNRYILGMVGAEEIAPAGGFAEFNSRLYVGPKIQDNLEQVAPYLNLTVDYGFLTIIAQPLFWLLDKIHGVVGNWGWAIIFLTVLIKAVFYKLSETSYRSMANMRRLQPRMVAMKERYGHDRQKMNQAMMELYKKEKINPLGGCLPIVVQIPVFIALYWMLLESVELRQAPFMLWIQDLSAKDPYYILPVVMGATMFIQQKLNPTPPDPIQAKVMMALPLVFTVFFLWFPSGLVLYWIVNNTLSILQQYVITKRIEAATAKA